MRIAVVAILTTSVAASVVSLVMLIRLQQHHALEDRAVATASGTVIQDGIGSDDDIRVRWSDDGGTRHVTRFGIYDLDRYEKGASFPVRYDPEEPDARPVPGDPEETLREDDLLIGAVAPWVLIAGIAVWWTGRAVRSAVARRVPSSPATANVQGGHSLAAGPLTALTRTTWVEVRESGRTRFQRVMWHPTLSTARYDEPVTVSVGSSRASIVWGDGTRLVPIGRLRDESPGRFDLEAMPAIRASRADRIVRRGTNPHDPWLQTVLLRGAYGATVGSFIAVVSGSPTLLWVAPLLGAALVINLWALAGADR